ncbi:hypothetical protein PENCOP_c005G00683 [Penicillium coprophilum]|uniref:Uncharacterized protein n=1 Tax=Penicillium coprophilum TaxID=36646 RepID=A0A1V6UR10_9EURO|nr:hypothetical protein PENCOP_c005G00683 [Penicillium coprophilum]
MGAGGYSIAPLLQLQPLLDKEHSVAYRISADLEYSLAERPTPNEYGLHVDHVIRQLQQAFDLREASPFDKVEWHGTERSLFDLFYWSCLEQPAATDEAEHRLRLLVFLLDCGSKPNRDILLGYLSSLRELCFLDSRLPDPDYCVTIYVPSSPVERRSIRNLLSQGHECTVPSEPMISSRHIIYVEDDYTEDTYHSIKLLTEAGWPFEWDDIRRCEDYEGSGKIKWLFINELVAQRKRLWRLAQSCLPAGQFPKLIAEDEKTDQITILDIHASEICARLVKRGIPIELALQLYVAKSDLHESVYHYTNFSAETLQYLYQAGFRGVTQLNRHGFVPLMTLDCALSIWWQAIQWRKSMERLAWLVSKGADPYQEVPGTSATVAHHLGAKMVDIFFFGWGITYFGLKFDPQEYYRDWKQPVLEYCKPFFLLPSVRDKCVCACSPGGCTTMSVVLRHIVYHLTTLEMKEPSFWFRELIQFLLWWTKGDTETGWEVIRFLSFDALGLKHSCCIEKRCFPDTYFILESREEEEVEEIHDEESLRIMELENLLDELRIKFDDLGQPVMKFLEGHWYTRMIDHLSQRDSYDEEHVTDLKRIGVKLEPEEFVVPDRVSLLIRPKIMPEDST